MVPNEAVDFPRFSFEKAGVRHIDTAETSGSQLTLATDAVRNVTVLSKDGNGVHLFAWTSVGVANASC